MIFLLRVLAPRHLITSPNLDGVDRKGAQDSGSNSLKLAWKEGLFPVIDPLTRALGGDKGPNKQGSISGPIARLQLDTGAHSVFPPGFCCMFHKCQQQRQQQQQQQQQKQQQ